MKRNIIIHPNDILTSKSFPVNTFDENLKTTITDMIDTLNDSHGVGLAANQIGILKQIIVIDAAKLFPNQNHIITLINPKITFQDGEIEFEEGCLSVPNVSVTVKRSSQIIVEAVTPTNKLVKFVANGLLAVVIQHEIDHLNGILLHFIKNAA